MSKNMNFSSRITINDPLNKKIESMDFSLYVRSYPVSSDWRTVMDYTSAIDLRYDENTLSGVLIAILPIDCQKQNLHWTISLFHSDVMYLISNLL